MMGIKAALFVVIGLTCSVLISAEVPEWKIALLVALAIWAFGRAYYLAFYVIEHYRDPNFRYSGLIAAVKYWWRQRGGKPNRRD